MGGANGGSNLPENGIGETAREIGDNGLSQSEAMPAPDKSVVDYGEGLTSDVLWRLRRRVKVELYRADNQSFQKLNLTARPETHREHRAELEAMLQVKSEYFDSRSRHDTDKKILTNWVARRAFERGKKIRLARQQIISELRKKYANSAQVKDLAEYLSYLLCFRVGLPIMPTHEMPQSIFVPGEYFPAEETPDYARPETDAPHRAYLSTVLNIRHEIELDVEQPGPFYSEGVDLRWNSWSTGLLHNASPYAQRFNIFTRVQIWRQDEGLETFSIGEIEAAIYRRHPICLFVDKYFRLDSGILDLVAIVQSSPGIRNTALRERFIGRVIAALEDGMGLLAPFANSSEVTGSKTRDSVEVARDLSRLKALAVSSAFYGLFAPDPVETPTGLYSQFSRLMKQPIGFDDPNAPERNVDWGAFGPLLLAASTDLLSKNEMVRSHQMKNAEDPLLILLRKQIFPGLDRWSVNDAVGYILLASGLVFGIAAVLASGGFAAPFIAGVALALDGLGIALSVDNLIAAIGDAGQMQFEDMFTTLKPALSAYQANTSVGWAAGFLIFDILMLGLPTVGRSLMPSHGGGSRLHTSLSELSSGTTPPGLKQPRAEPNAINQIERSVPEPSPTAVRDATASQANDPPADGQGIDVNTSRSISDRADSIDARRIEAERSIEETNTLRARNEALDQQADELLFGPEEFSETRQRAIHLSEEWSNRLVGRSREELEAIAQSPAILEAMPAELRAIFSNPNERVSSFYRHKDTGNLLYSVQIQGGSRGLVFPDAAAQSSRRARTGLRQPATGSPADRRLREIWDHGGYVQVEEIEGVRHTFYFDRRGRAWFHESQLDRGHIQSAVSKAAELKTRIIESLRRGEQESVVRERLAIQIANFNDLLNNLTPEARSFNRWFGGIETLRYGAVLDTSRPGLTRLTSGTELLENGLSDQARMGYDDIFDNSWYLASPYSDPRAARSINLSDVESTLSRALDEEASLRSLFAEDLHRLRTELLEDGLSESAVNKIISLCGFID